MAVEYQKKRVERRGIMRVRLINSEESVADSRSKLCCYSHGMMAKRCSTAAYRSKEESGTEAIVEEEG